MIEDIRSEIWVQDLIKRPGAAANLVVKSCDKQWYLNIPINLDNIIQKLKIEIVKTANVISGALILNEDKISQILVNDKFPIGHQRFTIAHEIGHLLLHEGNFQDNDSFSGDKRETEANKFAVSLLIPLYVLEPMVVYGKKQTMDKLANMFQVSVEALAYQLEVLAGVR